MIKKSFHRVFGSPHRHTQWASIDSPSDKGRQSLKVPPPLCVLRSSISLQHGHKRPANNTTWHWAKEPVTPSDPKTEAGYDTCTIMSQGEQGCGQLFLWLSLLNLILGRLKLTVCPFLLSRGTAFSDSYPHRMAAIMIRSCPQCLCVTREQMESGRQWARMCVD